MGVISSVQIFTQAFIMTDGGPSNASLFHMLYLYRQAFEYCNMGVRLGSGLDPVPMHPGPDPVPLPYRFVLGVLRG
jgi:hypothetical protein